MKAPSASAAQRKLFTTRLEEVGWAGTLEDYIVATVSSGRMAPPGRIGTWQRRAGYAGLVEHYGGPMRDDQIWYRHLHHELAVHCA